MICGVDEAGRGPVIGPLVVAGVNFESPSQLVDFKVRDSKKCTPKRRKQLADKIKKVADEYKYTIISASKIDCMRKKMTLNEIEVYAFSEIIDKLKPDVCYVDAADVNDTRFGNDILSRLSFKPRIISKHKADDTYPIVSAASILAKTCRDKIVYKIAKELKRELDLPLGSGYPADVVTQRFLKTWFERFGVLPPYTRCSWKTSQKILMDH